MNEHSSSWHDRDNLCIDDRSVYETVGDYALAYGSLEHSMMLAILRIEAERFPDAPEELFDFRWRALRMMGMGLLKEEVKKRVRDCLDPEQQVAWDDFINALGRIMEFRNRIMHNYSYVSNGVLEKHTRPTKTAPYGQRYSIGSGELKVQLEELKNRSEQLYGSIWLRRSPWVARYPMLPLPTPAELSGAKSVDCFWFFEDLISDSEPRSEICK